MKPFGTFVLIALSSFRCFAWDYEGHRLVNQVALASLRTNFPASVLEPEARERIAFLAGEPDRWRNSSEPALRHGNGPDHFLDLEDLALYKISPDAMGSFRYDFVAAMAAARATNGVKIEYDAQRDPDHVKLLPGFLPYSMTENYAKLRSGFSYLKTFEEYGTSEEITNARQNIIYIMGVMGHYVGDGAQPLHTTVHYNGWVGENPKGFTTNKTFHSWIDGGYLAKTGINLDDLKPKVREAKSIWPAETKGRKAPVVHLCMDYLNANFKLVEPLYQLEKDGKLSGNGTVGLEGKKFISDQLVVGGQMLGDLWFSAWQDAPTDGFLKSQLERRKRQGTKSSQ